MNTDFTLRSRQLTLVRYPEHHQHKSLQAWDSADELLIEHVQDELPAEALAKCIILNDDFGTLGCWFCDHQPVWVSDSHIASLSLLTNLTKNGLGHECITQLNSIAPLTDSPTLVLLKIPRTLALLEHQLIMLSQVITPSTMIVAAAKVKSITSSVLALFEKYIGATHTSLAKKKSRLILSKQTVAPTSSSPYPTVWHHTLGEGKEVVIHNHANVFSRQSLDIGARFMLEHMQVTDDDEVIDLGCGNGILGLNALSQAPGCKVHFVDESHMAIESAKLNVQQNTSDGLSRSTFHLSNCLDALLQSDTHYTISKVLCNPPFHQQNTITDHIAWQMFTDARSLLKKGGHLVVVANRHLDHHQKLKRLFGGVKVLASQKKFVILVAAKR